MWLKNGELHEPASTQSLLNLVLLDSPLITNYYLLLVLRRYLTTLGGETFAESSSTFILGCISQLSLASLSTTNWSQEVSSTAASCFGYGGFV